MFSVTLLQLLNYRKLSITITLCHSFIRTILIIRTPELSAMTRGVQIIEGLLYCGFLMNIVNLPIDVRGYGKDMEKQSMSDQKRVYVSILLGFKNCRKDSEEEHFSLRNVFQSVILLGM